MKRIKRFLILLLVLLIPVFASGCEENCTFDILPKPGDYDVSTFDDFANQTLALLIGNDELTLNFLIENPEDFGIEHGEPTLPLPSVTSATSVLVVNFILGRVNGYLYEDLNEDQKITYNIISNLVSKINSKSSEMSYLSNNYLGSYLGYQAQLPILLLEYKFRSELDIQNYLKLLDLVPDAFEKYYEFEVEKADKGYGMPNFVIDKVVQQCVDFLLETESDEFFMIKCVNDKIESCDFLTTEQKEEYKVLNKTKVQGSMCEGYEFIKDNLPSLKDRATNNMGLAHYYDSKGEPIGKKYYEIDFQDTVGYDITIPEAIEYLDNLIANSLVELNYFRTLYQTSTEFKEEFDSYILMNETPEEILLSHQSNILTYFPALENIPEVNIKYVDEAMEEHYSPASYMISAIDNLSSESIYLNKKFVMIDEDYDYNYLYTVLAHEGFAGHLYQNVYFKNTNASPLRKVLKNIGYTEGWATYAEMFSYEFLRGTFSNELLDFLILQDELSGLMYCRADMGINYEGWTLEETHEHFLMLNPNISNETVQGVYEQLIEVPNNPQEYYFTYFKIKDLLSKVKEIAGSDFDYVTFHKHFLDCGPAPLKYVEDYVLNFYE